jgi:hypothetical protein
MEHLAGLPGFAPTQREVTHSIASNIRAHDLSVLPILLPFEPRLNENLPVWINGRRLGGQARGRVDHDLYDSHDSTRFKSPQELSFGIPPVFAAVKLPRADLVMEMLDRAQVDGSARGEFGQTLLFELKGEALRAAGLDIFPRTDLNAQDLDGDTALMHAIRQTDEPLVYALITQGIDLEIRNLAGVLFKIM